MRGALFALAVLALGCGPMVAPAARPAPILPGASIAAAQPETDRPGRPVPGLEALSDLARDELGEQRLTVHFMDIGQGDAILVETPSGRRILVDSGPPKSRKRLTAYLNSIGARRIHVAINSHGHADHIGGLRHVIESVRVERVFDSGFVHPSKMFEQLGGVIEQKRIPFRYTGTQGLRTHQLDHPERSAAIEAPEALDDATALKRQQIVGTVLAESDGVKIKVLWPNQEAYITGSRSDPNANSVVLMVEYGKTRFLLTGDAEAVTEEALLRHPELLSTTVLKVAHHGSRHATSDAFLEASRPRLAVISCGANNRYGHPAPDTLARLEAHGVPTLITPDLGHIIVESDGTHLRVSHRPRSGNHALDLAPTAEEPAHHH
jgi:beta-lactamase superfamily II metal-dependent hydrolase